MIKFILANQSKVRIWLKEMPNAAYPVIDTVEHVLPAENLQEDAVRYAAVELFAHTGGHCPYGLLGAEFEPAISDELRVQVAVAHTTGDKFIESLAGSIDEVRVGLPSEYVSGVLEGVIASGANRLLGAGVIRFDHAAHGLIGSSPNIFRWLAQAVVELLQPGRELISEQELATLLNFSSAFSKFR